MSEQDTAFSLRYRPVPDDDSTDPGGVALDHHHHHPAAAAADSSSSTCAHYSNMPNLPPGPPPGDQPVEQVSDEHITGELSRNDPNATGAASAARHDPDTNQDALFDIAACFRPYAYPLSNPQPDDRLVKLVGFNHREFWVTMEAGTDLGTESIEHDGWAEASVRSIPSFHDTRDAVAWSTRWMPVIQVLSGCRSIEQLAEDDWTDVLGPYVPGLVYGGPSTTSTDVVAGDRDDMQDIAPHDDAVAPGSPAPAEDDEPATDADRVGDESSQQRNPFPGVTAQTPIWRLGQIVQNDNNLIPSQPSQTAKPAPIPLAAQRSGRVGSSQSRTGMRKGTFNFPCTHGGCQSGSSSRRGLTKHIERYHQNGDAHAACLLCGKMVINNADLFRRHRVGGQGCPQCATVVEAAGDIQVIGWRLLLDNPQKGPELFNALQFGKLFKNALKQWWAWEKEVDGPVWRWWRATQAGA